MTHDEYIRALLPLEQTQRQATTPEARRAAGDRIEALKAARARQSGGAR